MIEAGVFFFFTLALFFSFSFLSLLPDSCVMLNNYLCACGGLGHGGSLAQLQPRLLFGEGEGGWVVSSEYSGDDCQWDRTRRGPGLSIKERIPFCQILVAVTPVRCNVFHK